MSNMFFDLLGQTAEGKGGPMGLLFLAITMVLTIVLQLPGTWSQWKTVRNLNEAITALNTAYSLALSGYFAVFLIYGIAVRSVGSVFNVLVLGPVLWAITHKLYQRRGFTVWEWRMLGAIMSTVVAALIAPEFAYVVSSIVLMVFPILQMFTIGQKVTSKGVSFKMNASYGFVCFVWIWYGLAVHDAFIEVVAAIFTILYGGIVAVWWIYRPQPKTVR